jgi:hypothetical protein
MYTNPMAIGSLVAGLFSLLIVTTCFCCGPFALIGSATSVIAIILGLIALSQIKVGNGTGRGLAISGIICGLLSLLVLIAFVSWFFLTAKQNFDAIELPNADPVMIRINDDEPPELPKAVKKGEVQLMPSRPSNTPPTALQPKDVPDDKPQQPPKNQPTAPKEPD